MVLQMTDHYDILGVSHHATGSDIRASYVRLIKESHPDVNPEDDESTERSRLIVLAYTVLSDKKKRLEYDLRLKTGFDPESQTKRHRSKPLVDDTAKPSWADAPIVSCEICGKEDVVLRRYTFAWVASFIIETRHGHDSFVLCNACRLKKSAIYLGRVMLLGWWAIPIGFLFTFVAIFQNLFGGTTLPDQNAAILASHGYWLFTKGRFVRALRCLRESDRLVPGREKKRMIKRLQELTVPPSLIERVVVGLDSLNPASKMFIFLAAGIALFFVVRDIRIPGKMPAPDTGPNKVARLTRIAPDELTIEAGEAHINMSRFILDQDEAQATVKRAAIDIRGHMPLAQTAKTGAVAVGKYEFEKPLLPSADLNQTTTLLRQYLVEARTIGEPLLRSKNSRTSTQLRPYLTQVLDQMSADYYGSYMLSMSAAHYKQGENQEADQKELAGLDSFASDPMISGWLEQSGKIHLLHVLMGSLSNAVLSYNCKVKITELQYIVEGTEARIANCHNLMIAAQQAGDMDGYNSVVPKYNASIRFAKAMDGELNTLIARYNSAASYLNAHPINETYDECTSDDPLFSGFNKVQIQ
jgi:hypothetical protein